MDDSDVLIDPTAEAVRIVAAEAYRTIEKASLFGFALCTDDDVSALYHVFATRDWVAEREGEYPGIGFLPVEWEQQSNDRHFDRVSDMLREEAWCENRSSDYDAARTVRFQALVEALRVCRAEGLFDARTLLCVLSTDPDELMSRLTLESARLLNEADIAAAYCEEIDC